MEMPSRSSATAEWPRSGSAAVARLARVNARRVRGFRRVGIARTIARQVCAKLARDRHPTCLSTHVARLGLRDDRVVIERIGLLEKGREIDDVIAGVRKRLLDQLGLEEHIL